MALNSTSTYIYDNVLGYTDDGSGKAELAESWETPDDVTYLFNFAPGRAVFQDGAPVDANAMQANMEFLQTDEEASLNSPHQFGSRQRGVLRSGGRRHLADGQQRAGRAHPRGLLDPGTLGKR